MQRFLPLLLLVPLFVFAQQDQNSAPSGVAALGGYKGVHFENNLSWKAIQAKAKAGNKYIFMDCYTTWCGPCRYMAREIFPQDAAGSYFNDKFVSVAVQLDTTTHDEKHVRHWYEDAHNIAEKYGIRAYPTYLVFAPDGHVIHRLVGSSPSVDRFIARVADSFDSTKQYYTQIHQFESGRRDSAFLRRLALQCFEAYDAADAIPVGNAYLQGQTDLLQPGTLQLMNLCMTKSTDPWFAFFAGHRAQIDSTLGPGKTDFKLRAVLLNENPGTNPDWSALRTRIANYLPASAGELTMRIQVDYYRRKKDWTNFDKTFTDYMKSYAKSMPDDVLNSIAWTVFQTCPDMTCVAGVLESTKRLRESQEPAYLDTYANILYKLGKKSDAIALEEKAMNGAPDSDKASYKATIDKMKANEKTWN
jgi:thioredoxin-related protein